MDQKNNNDPQPAHQQWLDSLAERHYHLYALLVRACIQGYITPGTCRGIEARLYQLADEFCRLATWCDVPRKPIPSRGGTAAAATLTQRP